MPSFVDPRLQAPFRRFYLEVLGSDKEPGEPGCWWEVSRPLLDSGFHDSRYTFPLRSMHRQWLHEDRALPLADFATYVQSMSAYRALLAAGEADPLPGLMAELRRAAANSATQEAARLRVPFFLISGQLDAAALI